MMNRKKKEIDIMFKHNDALTKIPYVNNKNENEGYIYCIENSLFDGYSQKIYKVASTVNINKMIKEHNSTYFTETKILKQLKVKKKSFYEYMMILRLNKFRIKENKNFFINLNEIIKAFDEMETLINSKKEQEIHEYYLKYIDDFDKTKYCNIKLNIVNVNNNIPVKIYTKNKSINLNLDNNGFIYWLKHPYINTYYNDNIQIILISKIDEPIWIKSNFIEDIEIIKKIPIHYIGIAKMMLYELAHSYHIKTHYYNTTSTQIDKILCLIQKYFNMFSDKIQLHFAFSQRVIKLD